jgi:hypothetical protein
MRSRRTSGSRPRLAQQPLCGKYDSRPSLTAACVNVKALLKPVEDLVASFPTDDAAQRLAALVGTMAPAMLSDEALIRTDERIYMDTWLAKPT